MNVISPSTVRQAQTQTQTSHSTSNGSAATYKIEMLEDCDQSMASEDDDDDIITDDEGSMYGDADLAAITANDDVANQLAAAGPVGVAAAAAIASSKKRKRPHTFETNPSVRKRQQNRLLRKLRSIIYEFTGRVGKQAVVLVATPGKPNTSFKVFGAKPLEDVVRNLKTIVMEELESALAAQAPPAVQDDPSLFELPGLVIDGIPTPVEKMTQAQLRAFIPLMLKYSTGRGKPGWGRESTRPPWWPKELPWANVRMDARSEDDKQKISWTHALRKIVINCYKYHGREDLLPTFADDEDKINALISQSGDEDDEEMELATTTIQTIQSSVTNASTNTINQMHHHQQQQQSQPQQQQQVNVLKISSTGTVIAAHAAPNRSSAPTIIQSTNNQHVTTTATLPASTKIEICAVPVSQAQAQTQTQNQQQQHHHQHQQHANTTSSGSRSATSSGMSTVTATVLHQQPQSSNSNASSSSGGHQQTTITTTTVNGGGNQNHNNTTTVTAQALANGQVCMEPITLSEVEYGPNTVLSHNADGSLSLIQVDPNNPIITLPDGTTAQVQGVATLHQGEASATIQTVQSITDLNGTENMTVDLTDATVGQDGQIFITTEDGQGYPVQVSNVISMPVSMYQSMLQANPDGTVCLTPMQVENGDQLETITVSPGMHQMMIQGGPGQEPQLVQVVSIKDASLLNKAMEVISSGNVKSEETIIMEQ